MAVAIFKNNRSFPRLLTQARNDTKKIDTYIKICYHSTILYIRNMTYG